MQLNTVDGRRDYGLRCDGRGAWIGMSFVINDVVNVYVKEPDMNGCSNGLDWIGKEKGVGRG